MERGSKMYQTFATSYEYGPFRSECSESTQEDAMRPLSRAETASES